MLSKGVAPPPGFSRPETAKILMEHSRGPVCFYTDQFLCRIGYDLAMKRRPKGKNVEVALQLLQLSLALKSAVKKAARKR